MISAGDLAGGGRKVICDVPGNADAAMLAGFHSTIREGLSIKARDGASRKTLTAIIDGAMASWDARVSV